MARRFLQKDPNAAAELVRRAKEARERLSGIVQQIENVVRDDMGTRGDGRGQS